MNPLVVVILLTYARTEYALRTIRSTKANLKYDHLRWLVADDGSAPEHTEAVLAEFAPEELIGWHTLAPHAQPHGAYGANANKVWHVAHDHADLTLWLEDDWNMERPLELAPFVQLLTERADIGMVRLGYLNLGMRGLLFGSGGHLYWQLDRDADSYVFTGHPSLRHRRYREAYGPYPEGLNPGDTELAYAAQYRYAPGGAVNAGPEIVFPVDLGAFGPWGHIGQVKSY